MSVALSIGLVFLPVAALLLWAFCRPVTAATPARGGPAEERHMPCPVQLLFVAQVSGEQLLADGILLDAARSDTGLIPPGTPLTLRVRLPRDELVAVGMVSVLRGWADEDAAIEARFTDDDGVVRAQLGRDRVRLLVDLDDVVVAPRPAV